MTVRNLVFTLGLVLLCFLFLEITARLLLLNTGLKQKIFQGDTYCKKIEYAYVHDPSPEHVKYTFERFDTLKGWDLIPGTYLWGDIQNETLIIDSMSNRAHHVHNRPRQPKLRILTLGDSFTFGEEVVKDSTYSALMETYLPGVEVINLGVSGYGIDQMLLKFREYLEKHNADMVLLAFIENDIRRCFTDFSFFMKPVFIKDGGEWKLKRFESNLEELLDKYQFKSKFVMLLSLTIHKLFFYDDTEEKKQRADEVEILSFLLNEFKVTCEENDAELFVTVIPTPSQISNPDFAQYFLNTNEYSRQLCSDFKIGFINLEPVFLGKPNTELITSGVHWKADGNEMIARTVSNYLDSIASIKNPESLQMN